MSDMSWYMKGYDGCDGPDNPCWGLKNYGTDDHYAKLVLSREAQILKGTKNDPDWEPSWEFGQQGDVTELCVAKLWLAKSGGLRPTGAVVKLPGNEAARHSSPTTLPSTTGATVGVLLSTEQIAACTAEIKGKQVESQSWGGNVKDVSTRLGRFQKELFEGRCAGHPQAQAYITGANKMLAYGGNDAGSGGATSGNIEIQGTPQCAGYYVVSDTGETRTSPRKFSFGIRNTCNFPVYISWNGYFNNAETQTIDYSIQLKRGTSSRPVFGPGEKIEAIPFNIGKNIEFHAKIHSVCPTEDEASRITGKTIAYVAKGDGGMCIAKILDTRGVGASK
jgi:hypothetical protein